MPSASVVHDFGPFRLDTVERLLLRAGQPVSLTPKAFDLLIYLVERHGRLITKTELLRAVWPDTFVEEPTLLTRYRRFAEPWATVRTASGTFRPFRHEGTASWRPSPAASSRPSPLSLRQARPLT